MIEILWENSQNGKIPIVAIIFTIPMLFPHLDEKTMLPAAFRFIPFDFGPSTTLQHKWFGDDSVTKKENVGKWNQNWPNVYVFLDCLEGQFWASLMPIHMKT